MILFATIILIICAEREERFNTVSKADKEPIILSDKTTIRILKEHIKILEESLEEANENIEVLQKQIIDDDVISRSEVEKFVQYIQSIKDRHIGEGIPINYGTICDITFAGWKLLELPDVEDGILQNKSEDDI
jgi:hypothetical protein